MQSYVWHSWHRVCWRCAELAEANAPLAAVLHRVAQERTASGTWQDLTGLPEDAPEDEQACALPSCCELLLQQRSRGLRPALIAWDT